MRILTIDYWNWTLNEGKLNVLWKLSSTAKIIFHKNKNYIAQLFSNLNSRNSEILPLCLFENIPQNNSCSPICLLVDSASSWSILFLPGDELRWKFTSDGSVNGWGWRFTVYPIVTYAGPLELGSDRAILSQPSVELVMCLLDARLMPSSDRNLITRLATALASCAQLSSLGEPKITDEKFVKIVLSWGLMPCSL